MTDTEKPEDPRADVETVLAEFDRKKEVLATLCETTKGLIEKCLQGDGIRFQYVQARVKNRDKLRAKYLDPKKNYRQLDDITDQAGLRVITYYEDEVDLVARVIKREFEIDSKNSVDKREVDPEKFGYYALNYVCRYLDARTKHIEYKAFQGVPCEIQIMSILRHAWSEIEHPWYDLKDAFLDDIKRRFARMAALLEIAESEFLSLKKIQSDYVLAVGVQVETNVPDVPVDPVSLKTFIEQEPLVGEIDTVLASIIGSPWLTMSPRPKS
jgi:putative GTP pyrophosphokinase